MIMSYVMHHASNLITIFSIAISNVLNKSERLKMVIMTAAPDRQQRGGELTRAATARTSRGRCCSDVTWCRVANTGGGRMLPTLQGWPNISSLLLTMLTQINEMQGWAAPDDNFYRQPRSKASLLVRFRI